MNAAFLPVQPVGALPPAAEIRPDSAATAPADQAGFAGQLTSALDGLSAMERTNDELAGAMSTGQEVDPQELMLSAARFQLAVAPAPALRSAVVDAVQEVTRLQL